MKKRILWVSRHSPLPNQLKELDRIFKDYEVVQYNGFIRDAKHVVELMKSYKADEVVTILPMTIIYHLLKEEGIEPIFPEMERVTGDDYDYVDPGTGKRYKFKRFVRIIDFEIVKREL